MRSPRETPVTRRTARLVWLLLVGLTWALIGYGGWWIYRIVNP